MRRDDKLYTEDLCRVTVCEAKNVILSAVMCAEVEPGVDPDMPDIVKECLNWETVASKGSMESVAERDERELSEHKVNGELQAQNGLNPCNRQNDYRNPSSGSPFAIVSLERSRHTHETVSGNNRATREMTTETLSCQCMI